MGKIISPAHEQPIPLMAAAGLQHARVCTTNQTVVEVTIDGQRRKARVAFSCLVVPQPDDLVLCDCSTPDHVYILAVLERGKTTTTILSVPGAMVLQSKSTTLLCENDLNLLSGREIHKAKAAVIDVDEVTATGGSLQASYRRINLISQMINTMARHLISRYSTYLRRTEDHDQLQAGQLTRKVEGLYCMESRHTVMVSKKDTKIDGERIHMG